MSWQCVECGAEHADNILFCTACGAERIRAKISGADSVTSKHDQTGWWSRRSIDVAILIAALCLFVPTALLISAGLFRELSNAVLNILLDFFLTFGSILSLFLIFVALLRLCKSRALGCGYRLLLFFATIVFNPMVFICLIMIVNIEISVRSLTRRMNTADTNALVQACTHIIQHPSAFEREYHSFNSLTGLPPAIVNVKPVYVIIGDDAITIALIGGVDHRGWRFVRNDAERWALLSYDEYTQKVLLSNIVIATQTAPGGPPDEAGIALP